MLRRIAILAMVVGLVFLVALACGGDEAPAPPIEPPAPPVAPPPPPPPPQPPLPSSSQPPPPPPPPRRGLAVDLEDGGGPGPFSFKPADFSFSLGDTVDFTFISETQFHTFTVDDLGIDVSVNGGTTVNFEYTFDKSGTYQLRCIPHEALGMLGTIRVQ